MADKKEAVQNDMVASLFEKATTDVDTIASVSKYVRTGKRWDVTHKEIFSEVIVLLRVKAINTKYGPAYLASIDHRGERKEALIGGQVLCDQLQELEPNLPVITVIRKPGRAYSFTDPTPEEIASYKRDYLS